MTPTPSPRPPSRLTAKVLVTGPLGAGKTTFISTLTGPTPLATDRGGSPDAAATTRTTVAMDFGHLEVTDDLSLVVYGTPGHDRFGFMVDILAEGMLGYLLLVDASRPEDLTDARRLRRRFERSHRVPSVVVGTKLSGDAQRFERRVREQLELPAEVPVLTADARERTDVQRAVVALLGVALERASTRASAVPECSGLGDVG